MPRSFPAMAAGFAAAATRATELAEAGETARVIAATHVQHQPLRIERLELLYEMAYLRLFLEWETFLEQSFFRYMCGYSNSNGTATMAGGRPFYTSLSAAEAAVLGQQQYKLWHNPQQVIQRSVGYMNAGLHETVLNSNLIRLQRFAAIRHRVAHAQEHARIEFDAATMALAGRRYKSSRPGRFLRDTNITLTPPQRWLDLISSELASLAAQIVP